MTMRVVLWIAETFIVGYLAMTMLEDWTINFQHRHCEEQFWRSQKADEAIQFLISNFGKAKITSHAILVLQTAARLSFENQALFFIKKSIAVGQIYFS